MADDPLAQHDVALVRADNPGPFTLEGTNTWVVGRDPAWVVDPGPDLPSHVAAVAAQARARGGLGGIALTHGHGDHRGALAGLLAAAGPVPVGAVAAQEGEIRVRDGERLGPFLAVATPGHATDHLAFVAGGAGFSGDAVLGRGSVFVNPDPGALRGYLDGLRRLRELDLEALFPGHGPVVGDPASKLDEYVAHRLERERRLLDALARGLRGTGELLDEVWSDAPPALRPAAAVTLRAHLDKLRDEGRLPEGVDVPERDLGAGEV
jgi:glyoxylase-like metal-dependent hydrolase (beta-lactamase superfamily II)